MIQVLMQRDKCIGCNACVEAAPNRWQISRVDGKSILIGSSEKKGIHRVVVGDHEKDAAQTAAATCPVRIIRVEPASKK